MMTAFLVLGVLVVQALANLASIVWSVRVLFLMRTWRDAAAD